MKVKSQSKYIFLYKVINFFKKQYQKLFNSLFKQKLNSIILDLKSNKINLEVIYDIGAFRGEWSKLASKTSLKKSKFYLFEANVENEAFLKKTGHNYFVEVLSNEIKEVEFFSKVHEGDSYFREKTNFYEDKIKPKIIKTTTLNEVQKKEGIPLPDFIKIDTQGSELDILFGGSEILDKCKIILLECPIISYNEGAPTFTDYIENLNKLGYLPFDITEIHYLDKVLVQIDLIFLKNDVFHKIYKEKKFLNILN